MTRLVLKEVLEKYDITPYALAEKIELSRQAIYNLTSEKDTPTSIKFETLDKIIDGIKELTGESVAISDLIVRG